MENDRYYRTETADGYVDVFVPGEVIDFAKQNKAVRERQAARENARLQEENRKLSEKQRVAKLAAKAARKRQHRTKLACSMVIGTASVMALMLGGLVDHTVGTLVIAAGMAVGGYRMK